MALQKEKVSKLPLVIDHIKFVGSFTGLSLNLDKTIAFYHK